MHTLRASDERTKIGTVVTHGGALTCVLLALVGCDRVFGLDDVLPADTPDAPEIASCPAPGAGPPVFGTSIEEVTTGGCFYFTYSRTADLGYALCGAEIVEGPLGGPFQPIQIAPSLPGAFLSRPAISPDGTHLLVQQVGGPQNSQSQRLSWYAREGAAWTWRSDVFEATALTTPGVPSAGPDRRALIGTTTDYREFVASGDTWTELRISPWTTMGVGGGQHLHLSPNGLRLTFVIGNMVMYAERASLGAEFGAATHIASIGETPSAFITEDCARAYYSAGGAIVFRRQI